MEPEGRYVVKYLTPLGEEEMKYLTSSGEGVLDVLENSALNTLRGLPPGAKLEITFELDEEDEL